MSSELTSFIILILREERSATARTAKTRDTLYNTEGGEVGDRPDGKDSRHPS